MKCTPTNTVSLRRTLGVLIPWLAGTELDQQCDGLQLAAELLAVEGSDKAISQ
jgi:hypothetical protein